MTKQMKIALLSTILFAGVALYAEDPVQNGTTQPTTPDKVEKNVWQRTTSCVTNTIRSTVRNPWFYYPALVGAVALIGYKVYQVVTAEKKQKEQLV